MRRTIVLLTALATVLAFDPMGVARADSTFVVPGTNWPGPDDQTMEWDGEGWAEPIAGGCHDFTDPAHGDGIRYSFAYSDDTPAWGERVQGFDMGNSEHTAIGVAGFTDHPSTSTFDMRVRVPGSAASGRLVAWYYPPDNGYPWLGWATVTHPGGGWATISGTGAHFTWRQQQEDGALERWGLREGPASLADFVNSHGGDGVVEHDGLALLGMSFGCDTQRFHFDALRVGPPGAVETYDFEGSAAPEVQIGSSDSTITAGRPVTIEGSSPERFTTGVTMTLEQRPHGASEFSTVGTATAPYDDTTGQQGWAELVSSPKVRTEYQWVIPETVSMEQGTSPIQVVEVRTAVTAALTDSTLRKGETLVVKGTTTPRKSKTPVTLQRNVNGAWRTLATGLTATNGSYGLRKATGTAGKWKVRVQVAAASGNLRGSSPARTATVR